MTARYKPLTQQEIKQLTQAELIQIIQCHSHDITVFVGMDGNTCITPAIESVGPNGSVNVQINVEQSGSNYSWCPLVVYD